MKKETFPIPAGCKVVTIEQVGNQIVVRFEPEFKRGDVLIMKKHNVICVFNEFKGEDSFTEIVGLLEDGRLTFFNENEFDLVSGFRHATPEEAQQLWDALAKDRKRWNPEKMKIEEIEKKRWRANHYKEYYYINPHFEIACEKIDTYEFIDNERYSLGNYFQTKEQAQKALQKVKETILIFWKEELNKL